MVQLLIQLSHIIVGVYIFSVELQGALEARLGPVKLAQILQRNAQITVVDRVPGIFLDGPT